MNNTQDKIRAYFDRNPKLHVLFVFDALGGLQPELEDVDWGDDYIYHTFDGAWLNAKYNIEKTWADKRIILLFPSCSCPTTEEAKLNFPLLDLLRANLEYKEDDYASFMQTYGIPDKYRALVMRNVQELQSTQVAAVMESHYTPDAFNEDAFTRGLLSVYLGQRNVLDWSTLICRLIILGADPDTKKCTDTFFKIERNQDVKKQLDKKLTDLFGISYNPNTMEKMRPIAEVLKYNCITQLLDSNPADDYRQLKVRSNLAIEALNRIYDTGMTDRFLSPKFGDAMRTLGTNIRESEIISTYGVDAQYFYMTDALCWPILEELIQQHLLSDPDQVLERVRSLSLKLPQKGDAQLAIAQIEQTALYYSRVKAISTLKLNTPKEYVQRYTTEWHLIDQHYRLALEASHRLALRDVPISQALHQAKTALDTDYAKWCNLLNLEWMQCLAERGDGFDSLSLKKQEDFFQNEYDATTKQVVIISDAQRYEVAAELMKELAKTKHFATIEPYRAMLPTETKFCKPAMLPHHQLTLSGADMMVDGQNLDRLDARNAHIEMFKKGAKCVKYEYVMKMDRNSRRDLFKRPLVYIFHDTIDEAGHGQNPMEVVSACRKAVEELAALVPSLHATCNVVNVMITSDHGFIYNDQEFEEKDKHSVTDNCIEKKSRYLLLKNDTPIDGLRVMPLEQVSGIQAPSPTYVATPLGTNRLKANGGYNFAHGGAALQEMIIPVIKSYRKRTEKTEKVGVELLPRNLQIVSSRLKVPLIQSEATSMTLLPRTVVCVLECDGKEVCQPQTVTLDSADALNATSRVYEIILTLNTSVQASILQLRVYDKEDTDRLNPLLKENVTNKTLIENDFDF
ncbi:MAG: BREX-1 system phosphatase PglZ type A [Bacteroidales bacterium]|nr:BREX-1 system phosphatase PglZ type A [Bacteroidales bacterium]